MEEKQKNWKIFKCPNSLKGVKGHSKKCAMCNGFDAVLRLDGKSYFWGIKMSSFGIEQRRTEFYLRIVINTVLFLFGIIGFLALVKVIYEAELMGFDIHKVIYVKDEYMLVWWISVLVDMYLLYRITKESEVRLKINKKDKKDGGSYDEVLETDPEKFWIKFKKKKVVDVSKSFDKRAFNVVEDAWVLANKLGHKDVAGIHLFSALLRNHEVSLVFSRLGKDHRLVIEKVKSVLKSVSERGRTKIGLEGKTMLLQAYRRAYERGSRKVRVTDIIQATAGEEGVVKDILYDMEIEDYRIADVIAWVDMHRDLVRRYHEFKYYSRLKPKSSMNRSYTAIATPNLDRISRDMTLYARAGGYEMMIGREEELSQIYRVLETEKMGAVLVGPPGVGKRTLVEGVAQEMVKERVPKSFRDKRLVSLSASALVAGASRMGEIERRILDVMSEISRSKNIILFIEDIHHLVGISTDSGEAMDVAEAIAEQMQSRDFDVIATTTPEDYKKYVERSSLSKVLQIVSVNEMNDRESIRVLQAKALMLEAEYKVYFSYDSIEEAVKLSRKYLYDTYMPEKAIKLIEQIVLEAKSKRGEGAVVSKMDVEELVSAISKVPVTKISESETDKLLKLESIMHERIIGQEQAVKLVSSALRRARTELRGENRPIASFLFLGPTGVGKTEVAKTLARVYFGDEKKMIRVDMSEYQAGDAMAKLLGDSRSHSGGYLTEAVKKNPFSLILLDEIEKADQDILNVFLQILDDGRVTDATGRTVDLTNTIIIATSNAGSQFIQDGIKSKMSLEEIRSQLIDSHLKQYFRPEFINRFDGMVVFHPLEMKHVREIAKIFLGAVGARLLEQGVSFEAEEGAVDKLAEMGYDPTFGARPLRRVIQNNVEDQLAKILLKGGLKRRDKVVLNSSLELSVIKGRQF